MKRSLATYINKSGGFIDRNAPLATPALNLPIDSTENTLSHSAAVFESALSQPQTPVAATELFESDSVPDQILVEKSDIKKEMLSETLIEMKNFLIEQQENQNQMGKVIAEMLDTIKSQNILISQKFDQLDEAAVVTAQMLKETSNKLESLVIRELAIPAPVVNVSLSEQKRIVKTVDRDSNGLIKKITEEIEQSVSEK
jgi:hypothetical protein